MYRQCQGLRAGEQHCVGTSSQYVLWNKYKFGLNGHSPAKTIPRNVSIDKIYEDCGYKTIVTSIIKKQ